MSAASPILELDSITVRFPGVLACEEASLDLGAGEVHALVGENGAGKSTLMHCAAGVLRPTSGRIRFRPGPDRAPVPFSTPAQAQAMGIGMVFQSFLLVDRLTVLDNVVLGAPGLPWLLRRGQLSGSVRATCARLGIDLDLEAAVGSLSAGERQKTALVRAMLRDARVLVLDEPTAVLAPGEADRLLETMRRLAGEGVALLFVSHKLPEVMAVSDRITVMRRGRTVASGVPAASVTARELAAMMVGGATGAARRTPAARPQRGEAADAAGITRGAALGNREGGGGAGPGRTSPRGSEGRGVLGLWGVAVEAGGVERLAGIGMEVRTGEIVGVAGVSGNGQKELVSVCAGLLRPTAGRVEVGGADLTGRGAREFFEAGLSYVSEDRYGEASDGRLTLRESACLKGYRTMVEGRFRLLDRTRMQAHGDRVLRDYRVSHSGAGTRTAALSGGNLQKLILGRELLHEPRVLVVHQPTQGLDLDSARFVREELRRRAAGGTAVLLVSSDLDEVLELSDRVFVMYRGRWAGVFERPGLDRTRIGECMAGVRPDPEVEGAA